jgi:hypothetical protein
MAFSSRQITLVASTITPLLVLGTGTGTTFKNVQGSVQDPLPVIVQNTSATTAYIGGPDVSATNGFPLATNQSLPMALYNPSEIPYAFSTGAPVLAVLCGRQ